MNLNLPTYEDLQSLKTDIISELKALFNTPQNDTWLKSIEVKELLGCSDSTLQKIRLSGNLPFTKLSGTYYYKREDIQNLLNRK